MQDSSFDRTDLRMLAFLQLQGLAACTVAHTSARIGDAQDMWDHGVISHVNAPARGLGLQAGQALGAALLALVRG